MKFLIKLSLLLTVFMVSVAQAEDDAAIKERIKPVGEVCVEGDPCADAAPVAAAATTSGPRSGEDLYNSKCMACHGTGAAGAPMKGNAEQWAPRIEKGLDQLVANAISGINAMPPRGTCTDCSDDEIRGVVEFLVNASK